MCYRLWSTSAKNHMNNPVVWQLMCWNSKTKLRLREHRPSGAGPLPSEATRRNGLDDSHVTWTTWVISHSSKSFIPFHHTWRCSGEKWMRCCCHAGRATSLRALWSRRRLWRSLAVGGNGCAGWHDAVEIWLQHGDLDGRKQLSWAGFSGVTCDILQDDALTATQRQKVSFSFFWLVTSTKNMTALRHHLAVKPCWKAGVLVEGSSGRADFSRTQRSAM